MSWKPVVWGVASGLCIYSTHDAFYNHTYHNYAVSRCAEWLITGVHQGEMTYLLRTCSDALNLCDATSSVIYLQRTITHLTHAHHNPQSGRTGNAIDKLVDASGRPVSIRERVRVARSSQNYIAYMRDYPFNYSLLPCAIRTTHAPQTRKHTHTLYYCMNVRTRVCVWYHPLCSGFAIAHLLRPRSPHQKRMLAVSRTCNTVLKCIQHTLAV